MLKKMLRFFVLIMLILWIGGYALFIANVISKPITQPATKTDAIIVLTGGHNRIQTGLSLFSDGLSKNLFITGVHEAVTKADITKISDCCIILGHKATTTLENAYETKEWIEAQNVKTIRLVTSAYHMDRALLEFRHAIPNIKIIPHPVHDNHDTLQDINFWKITFSEYNKILFRVVILTLVNQG
ncbi:MAG: hypothetical protein COB14_04415 [Alphaproteobacteria bacterium]|nr:MAG: hypothetical protein COB14_04415 [Alphaproteobacteria bacterium]